MALAPPSANLNNRCIRKDKNILVYLNEIDFNITIRVNTVAIINAAHSVTGHNELDIIRGVISSH